MTTSETSTNFQPITIHFTYTASDSIQACRAYRVTTTRYKISIVITVAAFIIGCVTTFTLGFHWYTVVWFAIAVEEWFDLIRLLRAWLLFRSNRKVYSEPYEVTIDDSGIRAKTGAMDARRLWSGYTSAIEGKQLFLLVYGKWLYATLPKRAMSNEAEISRVREIIQHKIGSLSTTNV